MLALYVTYTISRKQYFSVCYWQSRQLTTKHIGKGREVGSRDQMSKLGFRSFFFSALTSRKKNPYTSYLSTALLTLKGQAVLLILYHRVTMDLFANTIKLHCFPPSLSRYCKQCILNYRVATKQ